MKMGKSMRQVEKTNWTESGECLFFSIRGAGTLIPGSRLLKSRANVYFFLDAEGFPSLLCFARTNCSSLLYSSALKLSRLSCDPLSCFGALRCLFFGGSLGLS
jgi:hypothetical protein